jgi:hypothetical protein
VLYRTLPIDEVVCLKYSLMPSFACFSGLYWTAIPVGCETVVPAERES